MIKPVFMGLLSNIAEMLPEVESILFDYFEIDEVKKTLTTCAISEQVVMLNDIIKKTRKENPESIIDLICHSQGTIVAALANPKGIRKSILLAPSFDMSLERTFKRYDSKTRPGAKIDLDGTSILPELGGLIRIVPAVYWAERVLIKPFDAYNTFAENTEMIMIIANQDEIAGKSDPTGLNPKVKQIFLDGNHGFHGNDRESLNKIIREIII